MQEQTALGLVLRLCKTLEAEGVVYCHWKSNVALDRSASGDNDLDLLVSRADVQCFTEILCRLGFKEARVPPDQEAPGVLSYYGYDSEADKLVHIHAHYQLMLGDDMTKNYRLPIERPFLESAIQLDLFKIPAPEFELIVFVVRMVLKHCTWDAILSRQGTLPQAARRELEYLKSQADQAQVYETLQRHMPYMDATLFDCCIGSLRPGCPVWTRVQVGQALQTRLQAHARRPQITDACLKLWRRAARAIRLRVFGQLPRKRLKAGGAIIAIVGGDGAGKSTVANELYAWLAKDLELVRVHMGKPPRSRMTITVRGFLKIGRLFGLVRDRQPFAQDNPDIQFRIFRGYPWALREVCAARDRYHTYVKARRFAANGGLVISDRYPLPQIKLMDGPQVGRRAKTERTNWLIQSLIKLEKKYYEAIGSPELLIILKTQPEIAVQRKTSEDAAFVRTRAQEVWESDWGQTQAHVIDACRSKAQVLSEIKSLIWSEL